MTKFLDTLDPKYYNQLTETNRKALLEEAPFRMSGHEKIQVITSRAGTRKSSTVIWRSGTDFNEVIARCYARHLKQILAIPGASVKVHRRKDTKEGIYQNSYPGEHDVRKPRIQAGVGYDLKSFNLNTNSTGDDFFRAFLTAKYWRRVYLLTGTKPPCAEFKDWRTRRLYEEPYDAETKSVG